jgi:hypothetical protein
MEPEGSLCSQGPATRPYPEPEKQSPQPQIQFKIHFNIILSHTPKFPNCPLPIMTPNQNSTHTSHFQTYLSYIIILVSSINFIWNIIWLLNELYFWTLSIVWCLKKIEE